MFSKPLSFMPQSEARDWNRAKKSCYKGEQAIFTKKKNVLHHFHSPIKKNWNLRHLRNSFLPWTKQKFKNLLMKRINQAGNFSFQFVEKINRNFYAVKYFFLFFTELIRSFSLEWLFYQTFGRRFEEIQSAIEKVENLMAQQYLFAVHIITDHEM